MLLFLIFAVNKLEQSFEEVTNHESESDNKESIESYDDDNEFEHPYEIDDECDKFESNELEEVSK